LAIAWVGTPVNTTNLNEDSQCEQSRGSPASVKAAMLAVAGGDGGLLVSRDSHRSIVAGLIFPDAAGQPQSVLHLRRPGRHCEGVP
jgi:hypothetical protein